MGVELADDLGDELSVGGTVDLLLHQSNTRELIVEWHE